MSHDGSVIAAQGGISCYGNIQQVVISRHCVLHLHK